MTAITEITSAIETLEKIQLSYCESETNIHKLYDWINLSIQCGLSELKRVRKEFKYKNCTIEFLPKQLLFSVIQCEHDEEGNYTGVTYDVAISIRPYLKAHFGSDQIEELTSFLQLFAQDLTYLSYEISQDIDNWCENVSWVFKKT